MVLELRVGSAYFVCLGRQLIADPAFPNKMAGGNIDEIIPCVGCTQRCMSFNDHDSLQEGDWGVSCIFNPMSNNRKDVQYEPTDTPKKVMVIGAGFEGEYFTSIKELKKSSSFILVAL